MLLKLIWGCLLLLLPVVTGSFHAVTNSYLPVDIDATAEIEALIVQQTPPSVDAADFPGQLPGAEVEIAVGEDIQRVVSQFIPGTTFILMPGIHRMQTIYPRSGDTIMGRPGAVLSGARLLTDFVREGRYWVATGQTQEGIAHGQCEADYVRCVHPEDLFIDDMPLRHVPTLELVEAGTWYFDYAADKIYFYDDPTGRTVETSVTQFAIMSREENIIIRDLVVEKFANQAQFGAIRANHTSGWGVENITVQLNHGVGLRIGNTMQVRNSRFLNNGQLGLGGRGDDTLIEGNEIAYNNFAGHRGNWEAGGTKFVRTHNLIIRRNHVHNNRAKGLWLDIDNIHALVHDNLAEYNDEQGIYQEIGYDAVIRNNIARYNGRASARYLLYGAQIMISSAGNVQVHDNLVIVAPDYGNGIGIIQQQRGGGAYGTWLAFNNRVYNNVVIHLGQQGRSGVMTQWLEETFWDESGNVFADNTYYVADAGYPYWAWGGQTLDWRGMQAAGQELGGQLVVGPAPEHLLNRVTLEIE